MQLPQRSFSINELIQVILSKVAGAASSVAVLGLFAFLMRNILASWIENYFGARTKERLSKLEALQAKEQLNFSTLREFVIAGKLTRNEALLTKQIYASEALWAALLADKRHTLLVQLLQRTNIEEIDKTINDGRTGEFLEQISKATGLDKFIEEISSASNEEKTEVYNSAARQRPFISSLAWALYSAHNSITAHAILTMVVWKGGLDTNLLKNNELIKTAARALPHQAAFLEKYGVAGTYYLLDEIEEALLKELRRFLRDGEADESSAVQAAEILRASDMSLAAVENVSLEMHSKIISPKSGA